MRSDSFSEALGQLDPASRALLDLSLRRGMRPEEIAEMLGAEPETVARSRDDALMRVAADVGMERYDQLDEVRAQLAELPADEWLGGAAPRDGDAAAGEPVATAEPEPAAEPEPGPAPEREPATERAPKPEREPDPAPKVERPPRERDAVAEPRPAAAPEPRRPLLRPAFLWAFAAVLLLAAIAALASLGTSDEKTASSKTQTTPQQTTPPPKPKARPKPKPKPKKPARPPVRLTAVGGAARGTAHLNSARNRLVLRLRGLPKPGGDSYTVWLYSSVIEAKSLASRRATKLDVNVKLPRDWRRYRYVDVSREPADGNPSHSGQSVARLATRALR